MKFSNNGRTLLIKRLTLLAGAAALCFGALSLAAAPSQAESKFGNVKLEPTKFGPASELQDIKAFCGTKPIKVALSDGFGSNSWRCPSSEHFRQAISLAKGGSGSSVV
jgi:hypothetical protein